MMINVYWVLYFIFNVLISQIVANNFKSFIRPLFRNISPFCMVTLYILVITESPMGGGVSQTWIVLKVVLNPLRVEIEQ